MSLDSIGEAPTKPIIVGHSGVLLKKSGGKAFEKKARMYEKWTKRYFVLPPGKTELKYFKNEAAYQSKATPLGTVEVQGAVVFLKAVKSGQYRFTVRSAARELKLRAGNATEYDAWMGALQPITEFREDDAEGGMAAFSIRDEDDADFDAVGDDVEDEDDDDVLPPMPTPLPPMPKGVSRTSLDASLSAAAGLDTLAGPPMTSGMRGPLEKKSGGKAGQNKSRFSMLGGEKWSKRWFILKPEDSILRYYKSEADANAGKEPLGEQECRGATVFLKKVEKGGIHRFTVQSAQRALKLRAPNKAVFDQWVHALRPLAAGFEDDDDDEDGGMSGRARGETVADGDDDSD